MSWLKESMEDLSKREAEKAKATKEKVGVLLETLENETLPRLYAKWEQLRMDEIIEDLREYLWPQSYYGPRKICLHNESSFITIYPPKDDEFYQNETHQWMWQKNGLFGFEGSGSSIREAVENADSGFILDLDTVKYPYMKQEIFRKGRRWSRGMQDDPGEYVPASFLMLNVEFDDNSVRFEFSDEGCFVGEPMDDERFFFYDEVIVECPHSSHGNPESIKEEINRALKDYRERYSYVLPFGNLSYREAAMKLREVTSDIRKTMEEKGYKETWWRSPGSPKKDSPWWDISIHFEDPKSGDRVMALDYKVDALTGEVIVVEKE